MHIQPSFLICANLDCFTFMPWFHRFNKAYETIEYGDILDALTDLTGAICEYFTPDVNPPEQFFYTLYTSVVNRSLVVCWRNEKRLTWSGFNFEGVCNQKAQIQIPCDMYYILWINGVVLWERNIDHRSFFPCTCITQTLLDKNFANFFYRKKIQPVIQTISDICTSLRLCLRLFLHFEIKQPAYFLCHDLISIFYIKK